MVYRPRALDSLLDTLQPHLPAIVLQGPKAVGKTATAGRRANTVLRMDRLDERELLTAHRDHLERLPSPVFIDEWQQLPESWDYVRQAVDRNATGGRFLMAGSSAPQSTPVHSGAGRLVTLRMRPLSLAERGLAPPTVSLGGLLAGTTDGVQGTSNVALPDYLNEILASGLPGLRGLPDLPRRHALKAYLDAVVQREFPEQGLAIRRPDTLRSWLRAYAAATATTASYTAIMDAATPAQADKPARSTTVAYRDVLDQLWLLDSLPAWLPSGSQFTRLATAPKHFLADPALAAALLDLDAEKLLTNRGPASTIRQPASVLGALFEHLVALSVQVYAQASDARVAHFRARDGGHEVDLIVEKGESVVAIEVKLAADVTAGDVTQLRWLRERLGDRLLAALVVTTGKSAYQRPDGIMVVPAALLGP